MYNPMRLSLARRRRKLSKKTLAEALSLDQKTIIRYESGEAVPPSDSMESIAEFLQFPLAFFYGNDVDELDVNAVSFRSLSSMPARDRDAALAAGSFALMLADWVMERFNLPAHDLIDFKEGGDPEGAAQMLRQKWDLGEQPIKNMVHLLEAKGVRVFSLAENTKEVDAFALWRRNVPCVFLNTAKTAERSRFDAAHELGHLVLHKHGGPRGRGAEDQANQFASAFLMPEADVKAKLPRVLSLQQIVEWKKRWRVSVAALNFRLHKLKVTTDWQYKNFCIQIGEKYRQTEPDGIPRETSIIWEKVLTALRDEGIGKQRIATDLNLPVAEIENLIFQLTNMQSIDGSGSTKGKSVANLKLIHG